jgi:hypothetical protein
MKRGIKAIFLGICLAIFSASQTQAGLLINFDDRTAPPIFVDTMPLTNEYASLGVNFSGGGHVLNSDSGFGMSLGLPFSAPNFLAFNAEISGASPPETITFNYLVSSFSLDFAGSVGTISLRGFRDGGFVNAANLNSNSAFNWSTLTLAAGLYDTIVFEVSKTDGSFVVDNLSITAVPEPAGLVLGLTAGAAGLFVRRRRSF